MIPIAFESASYQGVPLYLWYVAVMLTLITPPTIMAHTENKGHEKSARCTNTHAQNTDDQRARKRTRESLYLRNTPAAR